MERQIGTLSIRELQSTFVDIEFPEYQREPDIWSRDQKQRLIDSILRRFDIASIYLYQRTDGGLECIDGRQRLNAIMSFLGENETDQRDNNFPIKFHNEISSSLDDPFQGIDGLSYRHMIDQQTGDESTAAAIESLLGYELSVIYLSDSSEADEFNLQFLRLNLGTLINAGEKLNAMVGQMRDLLFVSDRIGRHPFFNHVGIPTRRFTQELTAAQVLLQAFSMTESNEFTRARHFDLQKFVKARAEVDPDDPTVVEVSNTLDVLEEELAGSGGALRNRAITISVILLAWQRRLFENSEQVRQFRSFLEEFLSRLRYQVDNMKRYDVDPRYGYLVEFQRHLTQASVEKPAVTKRHEILDEQFSVWLADGRLTGDAE